MASLLPEPVRTSDYLFKLSAAFVIAGTLLSSSSCFGSMTPSLPCASLRSLFLLFSFADPLSPPHTPMVTRVYELPNSHRTQSSSPLLFPIYTVFLIPQPTYVLRTQNVLSSPLQTSPLSPSPRSLSASLVSPLEWLTGSSDLVCPSQTRLDIPLPAQS